MKKNDYLATLVREAMKDLERKPEMQARFPHLAQLLRDFRLKEAKAARRRH